MKIKRIFILLLIQILLFTTSSCKNNIKETTTSAVSSKEKVSEISELSKSSSNINYSGKGEMNTDKMLTVGYIGPGAMGAWHSNLSFDIMDAAEEWNIILEFRDSQGKYDLQLEYIEELIKMDVDAIGFVPLGPYVHELVPGDGMPEWTGKYIYDTTEWENTLKKAKEAGIPIILINRTVNCADESLWTTYIVNDWYGEGEMAGKWIIENINTGKNVDEEIKVLEVTGEYYSQYSNNYNESIKINQIKEGFRKGIEKNEKVRIVDTLPGGLSNEQSLDVVKEYLRKDKEIDIVFCQSDDMVLGVINAIKAVDMIPGEDIQVISIEGTNAALEAIVEGKIECSVETNPLLGDLFMEACVRLANGEEIEREIHPVDRVFDITNAQAELDARKENGYGY